MNHLIIKPVVNTIVPSALSLLAKKAQLLIQDLATVSVTLNTGYSIGCFYEWAVFKNHLLKSTSFRGDRSYRWDDTAGDLKTAPMEPGIGRSWFVWEKRLYWAYILPSDKNDDGTPKQVVIQTYGIDQKPLRKLLNEFIDTDSTFSKTKVFNFRRGEWRFASMSPKETLDDLILPDETLKQLKAAVHRWRDNKEWFIKFRRPRKLTVLLHGEPGTGKTSIAKAIAGELHLQICRISLAEHSDTTLRDAIDNAPNECVFSLDDVDAVDATHTRGGNSASKSSLRISSILDILQGVGDLDGKIFVLTTNHIEQLDPAVIRPGRIDLKLQISPLNDSEIRTFISRHYEIGDEELEVLAPAEFPATPISVLSTLFGLHPDSIEDFLQAVYMKELV